MPNTVIQTIRTVPQPQIIPFLYTKQCCSKYIISYTNSMIKTRHPKYKSNPIKCAYNCLSPRPHPPSPINFSNKNLKTKHQQGRNERTNFYDFLLKALYMLVEMAIRLVTTASIIIISAIILSLLVDIPYASLKLVTKKNKTLVYLFVHRNF